jgi:hypothetical protein
MTIDDPDAGAELLQLMEAAVAIAATGQRP